MEDTDMSKPMDLNLLQGKKDNFEFETRRLDVRIRLETKSSKSGYEYVDRERKGRIHVWGAPEPSFEHPPYMERGKHPNVDKEWDRFNTEEVRIMREVVYEALSVIGHENARIMFSKHAGCSMCPCSPGFIVKGETFNGLNVFIDVKRPVRGLLPPATSLELRDFDEVIFPEVLN